MLGRNTSGLPAKKFYNLGFGCLYLSELDASTGLPDCYRALGEAPAFSVTAEVETLEHRTVCSGLNVIDDRVEISKSLNLSVTLEELNNENTALFFGGSQDTIANPAVAGLVSHLITSNATKACTYDIKDPVTFVRALELVQASDVALTHDSGGTPLVLTLDVDYALDLKAGTFTLLEGGAVAIDGTKTLELVLTANAGAPATVSRVKALLQTAAEYAMKFIGVNGRNGKVYEIEFHSVRLSADGEVGLISPEELTQLTLSGVAQSNSAQPGDSKTMTITVADS